MSRLVTLCLSGLAIAAVSTTLTSAQTAMPHPRPGEWDTVFNMMGMTMNGQMCMDESEEARAKAFQPPMAQGGQRNCSQIDTKPLPGGGMHIDATCTTNAGVIQSSTEVTGDFQNNYRVDMTIRPDKGGEQKVSVIARRVGECPADLKPGHMVMKMDMDMKAMAAAAAAARQNAGR